MKQKSELTLIRNEYRHRDQEMETHKKHIKQMNQDLNLEISHTNRWRQDIQSMENELIERERTIKDKQKKIDQYFKQTQELEKFKFVLDYKIKELKSRIGPRMKIIQGLQEQKNKMDTESKHFNIVNNNLKLIVLDMRLKGQGMQKEMGGTLDKINQQQEYMKKFKNDVYDILNNHLNDYKKLKRGIKRLHRIYVIEEHNQKETGDNDIDKDHKVKRE